jgi:hypothetical protein
MVPVIFSMTFFVLYWYATSSLSQRIQIFSNSNETERSQLTVGIYLKRSKAKNKPRVFFFFFLFYFFFKTKTLLFGISLFPFRCQAPSLSTVVNLSLSLWPNPKKSLPSNRYEHTDLGLAILTRPANPTRTRHEYIGFEFML